MILAYSLRQQPEASSWVLREIVEWEDDEAPAFFVFPTWRAVAADSPSELPAKVRAAAAAGVHFDVYRLDHVLDEVREAVYVYSHTEVVRE